jgi:hypothetical protein
MIPHVAGNGPFRGSTRQKIAGLPLVGLFHRLRRRQRQDRFSSATY